MIEDKEIVLCCLCGIAISYNPAVTCINCLKSRIDISADIIKQVTINQCKGCLRFQQNPGQWVTLEAESKQLLTYCLKKIKASLKAVNVVNASFIWTEPHCKRLRLKLTIQREVVGGAILEKTFPIEFILHNEFCEACHRVNAKNTWKAVVQIRQKSATHKRTLLKLEQLLLINTKNKGCAFLANTYRPVSDGMDVFFGSKDGAKKFVDFITCVTPSHYKYSQKLVSRDEHTNSYNYKSTYSVDISAICKDDVVCLSATTAQALGSIPQLAICTKVNKNIFLTDPISARCVQVDSVTFFKNPFYSIYSQNKKSLTKFIVMEIDKEFEFRDEEQANLVQSNEKFIPLSVWVTELDSNNFGSEQIYCRTHMGRILHLGDVVLGLDLRKTNINNAQFESIKNQDRIPDVILIKKIYLDNCELGDPGKSSAKMCKKKAKATYPRSKKSKSKSGDQDDVIVDTDLENGDTRLLTPSESGDEMQEMLDEFIKVL